MLGIFDKTCDIDPGPGGDFRTSNGSADVVLSKKDQNGNYLWGLTWGGPSYDIASSIAVDTDDNLFATGSFGESADMDPGLGVDTHNSAGMSDIYLSKFDADGNLLWCRTWGGKGIDESRCVATDSDGSVYITGSFCGSVDFDPGEGEEIHESIGYNDSFLCKFDSNGTLLWIQTWGGDNLAEYD